MVLFHKVKTMEKPWAIQDDPARQWVCDNAWFQIGLFNRAVSTLMSSAM